MTSKIKQVGKIGQDIWISCLVDSNVTRKILFSQEMQDDLESDIHNKVLSKMYDELNLEPTGPDLKVAAVDSKSETGGSKKEFCFQPLQEDTKNDRKI